MQTPTHPKGEEGPKRDRRRGPRSDRKPSVRQIYALAAALAERLGEEFPATAAEASALIERLRAENGHPAPRLDDTTRRGDRWG